MKIRERSGVREGHRAVINFFHCYLDHRFVQFVKSSEPSHLIQFKYGNMFAQNCILMFITHPLILVRYCLFYIKIVRIFHTHILIAVSFMYY